jgi:hypothetical protein
VAHEFEIRNEVELAVSQEPVLEGITTGRGFAGWFCLAGLRLGFGSWPRDRHHWTARPPDSEQDGSLS